MCRMCPLVQSWSEWAKKHAFLQFAAVKKFVNLVGTFGYLFFSLQGLTEGSGPHTNPKIPFPYWKIDHFVKEIHFLARTHLRIRENQQKSAGDG